MKELEEIKNKAVITEQKFAETRRKIHKYEFGFNEELMKSYIGDKHNPKELNKKSGVLSVERTAAHSMAFLMLLGMKDKGGNSLYTIDQLVDPKQFTKEKQELFDNIVNHSRKAEEEKEKDINESPSSKWLVENLYAGMKTALEKIDELADKIGDIDDDLIHSDEFIQIGMLGEVLFDNWQEINRFTDIMNVTVMKDRPELKTAKQVYEYMANITGAYSEMMRDVKYINDNHEEIKKNGRSIKFGSYYMSAFGIMYTQKVYKDWKKNGNGRKFSDYCLENNISFKYGQMKADAMTESQDLIIQAINNEDIDIAADKHIMNGSLFAKVTYDDNNRNNGSSGFENLPVFDEEKGDFVFGPEIKKLNDRVSYSSSKNEEEDENENNSSYEEESDNGSESGEEDENDNEILTGDKEEKIVNKSVGKEEKNANKSGRKQKEDAGTGDEKDEHIEPEDAEAVDDFDKIQATFRNQIEPEDNIWLLYQYTLKTVINGESTSFLGNALKKYGLTPDFNATEEERKQILCEKILDYLIPSGDKESDDPVKQRQIAEDTTREMKSFFRIIGKLRVKAAVKAGKDYEEIKKALDGEENSEAKARYLFNYGGCRTKISAYNQMIDNLELQIDYIKDSIYTVADVENKAHTFKDYFDFVGFDNTQREKFLSDNKIASENVNIWDFYRSEKYDDQTEDQINWKITNKIKDMYFNTFKKVYLNEGRNEAVSKISTRDKKLFETANNVSFRNVEEDEAVIEPIRDWIKSTGEKMSVELLKYTNVTDYKKAMVAVQGKKIMGVSPKREFNRFYSNDLKIKNPAYEAIIKNGASADSRLALDIKQKKWEKLHGRSPKGAEKNLDNYIELHTAERMGDTPDDMVNNLAKALAASILKIRGKEFDVKAIHKTADIVKDFYSLDAMKREPDKLREALRDAKTVKSTGRSLRLAIYGMEAEKLDDYTNDMKTLLDNMVDPKGHSDKYKKLYDSIKAATELKDKLAQINHPAEKLSQITEANVAVFSAAADYMKGKEKVRTFEEGRNAFSNALDAIAVLTKHAPNISVRTNKVLKDINKVRNNNRPDAANYINADTFTQNYGAQNAKNAVDTGLNKKPVSKGAVKK